MMSPCVFPNFITHQERSIKTSSFFNQRNDFFSSALKRSLLKLTFSNIISVYLSIIFRIGY